MSKLNQAFLLGCAFGAYVVVIAGILLHVIA